MQATEEYIQLLASALSESTGVKVTPGKKWRADVVGKELEFDERDLRYLPFEVVRGLLLHEISHLLHTTRPNPSEVLDKYKQNWHQVINCFEDIRIEPPMNSKFGDFSKSAFKATDSYCVMQQAGDYSDAPKSVQFCTLSLLAYYSHQYNFLAYKLGDWAYNIWGYDSRNTTNQYYQFDEEVLSRWRENSSDLKELIDELRDTYPLVSFAQMQDKLERKVLPIIKDWLETEEQPKQDGSMSGDSDGQQQDQDPKDGNQPQDGKPKQGDQKQGNLIKPSEDKLAGLKGGEQVPEEIQRRVDMSEAMAKALMRPYAVTLATRLREILKEKTATRWRGASLSGKLLAKNAYKVAVPGENRIFSKRNTPDSPSYSVYVALDCSGSMSGERGMQSFLGTAMLKKMSEALGFKFKAIQYDDRVHNLDNLGDYNTNGGGTQDSYALEQINKDLDGDEENLVLFITDGETCGLHDSDRTKAIRELEKKSTFYGIGIGKDIKLDTLKQAYPNPVCVQDVKDLPQTMIGLVRRTIHR